MPTLSSKDFTPAQRQALGLPAKRSKYGNTKTVVNGLKFDSKREAAYYGTLCLARDAGKCWFVRQPSFDLPGGIRYVADFLVVWTDGSGVDVVDAKGMRTSKYRLKKKLVEATYPIRIVEV